MDREAAALRGKRLMGSRNDREWECTACDKTWSSPDMRNCPTCGKSDHVEEVK